MQKTMTVAQLKADFSNVLANVQNGVEYQVLYGRNKKPVALLSPLKNEKRSIGVLEGLAHFSEIDDGKITLEEFLGL